MQAIKTIQGHLGGSLEIYDNKVVIKKRGLAGIASKGANDKDIWMKSITGIQIKKPNILQNGNFSILSSGENANKTKDENTIIFLKKSLSEFEEAKALIESLANK